MPETRIQIIRSMLNNLIGNRSPRHTGTLGTGPSQPLRRFWDLPRDSIITASVYGQRAVIPGNSADSALIKALKGDPPFNGSFARMPPGGPYLGNDDIAFIARWIDDGAPDADSEFRIV